MSDVNEFFDDLENRLKKIAPEKELELKKTLVELRWDWRSAQLYISPQPLNTCQFLIIRKQFEEFLLKTSKENGVSTRALRKRLFQAGRPSTQSFNFQNQHEQQLDLAN